MGDWSEMEVEGDDGERSTWTREANTVELAAEYREGRLVRIEYVEQRSKVPLLGIDDSPHRIPVRILVG